MQVNEEESRIIVAGVFSKYEGVSSSWASVSNYCYWETKRHVGGGGGQLVGEWEAAI